MKCELCNTTLELDCPKCGQRQIAQHAYNESYMLGAIDRIHDALCPDESGTWQQRCEQAIAAAELLSNARLDRPEGAKETT